MTGLLTGSILPTLIGLIFCKMDRVPSRNIFLIFSDLFLNRMIYDNVRRLTTITRIGYEYVGREMSLEEIMRTEENRLKS